MATKAARLAVLGRRIFGEVVHPPNVRSPNKYIRKLKGRAVLSYFPEHVAQEEKLLQRLHSQGLWTEDRLEWKIEKREWNKSRGKSPPKKGEGKRAGKKKR
eukprot:m.11459 g.11459  ORF g.11459 m.11459 type:complete len:101 (+) comp4018_c0_seq1:60-362(+)